MISNSSLQDRCHDSQVVLFDHLDSGHHRRYLDYFIQCGRPFVFVALPSLADYVREKVKDRGDWSVIDFVPSSESSTTLARLWQLAVFHDLKGELVFLMVDHFVQSHRELKVLKRRFKLKGIWFRSSFLYRTDLRGRLTCCPRIAYLKCLNRFAFQDGLYFLDRLLASMVGVGGTHWLPDPVQAFDLLVRTCTSDPPRLLMIGQHQRRKGTRWAIERLRASDLVCELRVVGEWDVQESDLLTYDPPSDNTGYQEEIINARVSESDYQSHFEWADIVLLPYNDFGGSSGVLLEALLSGRAVVAADFGVVGRMIREWGGGFLYDSWNGEQFIHALSEAFLAYPSVTDRDNLRNIHSVTNFVSKLLAN